MIYDTKITVHELFQNQVLGTPNNIAVIDAELSLSYKELNKKANQLAEYLILKGASLDEPIGLCLHRSADALIAILGILKAGAAFMPLDPHSPIQRLQSIISNSRAKFVISERALINNFTNYSGELILIDTEQEMITAYDGNDPEVSVLPNHLAYIIHTSGSTGEPKGVATEHEPLCNLILWHKNILQDGGLRTLGFMPLTFDASIQEFFTTCCTGGTYYITSDNLRLNPDKLAKHVLEQKIERVFMTFTPLQHFIKAINDNKFHLDNLRSIINVGEPLVITQPFRDFFFHHPICELHNQYGLTETAVDMTDYKFQGSPNVWPERPSAGNPITNAKIYILDEELHPVADGNQGEIFVGGMSLAREFINNPELTNEKFLSDPFSEDTTSRIYRTGDLGQWLSDGSFQCLGRKDSQVKIRGFRVELGEIQTALLQHSGIKEAAAHVFELQPGEKQLVAYLVSNQEQNPNVFELRSFLATRLPDYMIPHAFITLEKLPMTAHGKLNRQALPKPGSPKSNAEYVQPGNAIEKELVMLWQHILKVDRSGINDDFFIMGGDSLLAAQLLAKIENNFAVDIALDNIYKNPTIAELSAVIDERAKHQHRQEQINLTRLLDEIENMTSEEVSSYLSDI